MSNEPPTDALRLVHELAAKGADTPGCDNWRAVSMCRQIVEVLDKAAPASPLPGGGWQDISTLPQKGAFTALVDVWATGPGKDSDVSHYRITDCWRREDGVWFSMSIGELKQSRVTHWMPLPAAPTGAK